MDVLGCSESGLWGVRAYACVARQGRQQATAALDTSRRVAELERALLDLDNKVCWTGVEEKTAGPSGHIMIGRIRSKHSDGQTWIFARIAEIRDNKAPSSRFR